MAGRQAACSRAALALPRFGRGLLRLVLVLEVPTKIWQECRGFFNKCSSAVLPSGILCRIIDACGFEKVFLELGAWKVFSNSSRSAVLTV